MSRGRARWDGSKRPGTVDQAGLAARKKAGGRLSPRKAHRRDRPRAKKPMNRRKIRRRRRAAPLLQELIRSDSISGMFVLWNVFEQFTDRTRAALPGTPERSLEERYKTILRQSGTHQATYDTMINEFNLIRLTRNSLHGGGVYRNARKFSYKLNGMDYVWVRLFFVGGPRGRCERHGKSYLTRRRRGGEGGGGGSLTGGAIPSAYRRAWFRWYSRFVEVPVHAKSRLARSARSFRTASAPTRRQRAQVNSIRSRKVQAALIEVLWDSSELRYVLWTLWKRCGSTS